MKDPGTKVKSITRHIKLAKIGKFTFIEIKYTMFFPAVNEEINK